MVEVWRTVPGHPGFLVSDKEHLWNVNTNNLIVGYVHEDYRVVTIDGHDEKFHRIVALAFPEICGEWFDGCLVHHKDHNKLNNVPDNLEVISRFEHQGIHNKEMDYELITKKVIDTKKRRYPYGHNAVAVEQYSKTGVLLNVFVSIKEAAKAVNMNASTICNALAGRKKTAGGYIWKYKKET